jgi:hypothetical protein
MRPGGAQLIYDQAATTTPITVNGTTYNGLSVEGTSWPLRIDQFAQIWNLSLVGSPSVSGQLQLNSAAIFLFFEDSSGGKIGNLPGLTLASWNATTPTTINGKNVGAVLSAFGDPIIEISAGLLTPNVPQVQGGITGFSLVASMDVFNADSASHTITLSFSALLSLVPRIK